MELAELLKEVRAHIPNISVPMASRVIKSVINDFLGASQAYRHECTVSLAPGIGTYRLIVPEGTRPTTLISAVLGKELLRVTHVRQLDNENPAWRTEAGKPLSCWLDYDNIRITPVPDDTYIMGLHVLVALGLHREATYVDTGFAEDNFNTIIDGTLSRLFNMPGTNWHNTPLAAMYQQSYEKGLEMAKDQADGNDTPKLRVCTYGGY